MKTKIQTLMCGALFVAGVMLAPTIRAEGDQPKPPHPAEQPKGEHPKPPAGGEKRADRLQQMREHLELTDEQVEKLKPILMAQQEEIKAVRQSATAESDPAVVREKMKAIKEKYTGQIDAILTSEQKAKKNEMAKKATRKGGPDGAGAGGPPPPKPE